MVLEFDTTTSLLQFVLHGFPFVGAEPDFAVMGLTSLEQYKEQGFGELRKEKDGYVLLDGIESRGLPLVGHGHCFFTRNFLSFLEKKPYVERRCRLQGDRACEFTPSEVALAPLSVFLERLAPSLRVGFQEGGPSLPAVLSTIERVQQCAVGRLVGLAFASVCLDPDISRSLERFHALFRTHRLGVREVSDGYMDEGRYPRAFLQGILEEGQSRILGVPIHVTTGDDRMVAHRI